MSAIQPGPGLQSHAPNELEYVDFFFVFRRAFFRCGLAIVVSSPRCPVRCFLGPQSLVPRQPHTLTYFVFRVTLKWSVVFLVGLTKTLYIR